MEILDRYLASVRSCLPEAQRDDIVNELSENIRSQIEDQESGLARPLSEEEVGAILKQHGHPLVVAARYRQNQGSLSFGPEIIGPTLFPFYLRVLKYNLGLTSLIMIALFTALFMGGQVNAGSIVPAFFYQFLVQFVVVTIIFVCADRHWKKHPDQWDYRKTKHPWHPAFAISMERKPSAGKRDLTRISPMDSTAQFVAMAIGLVWLRVAQHSPFMIFGPAALFLKPGPVWQAFYIPVVVLFFAGMAQAAINIFRPDWVRFFLVYRIFNDIALMIIFALLLKTGGGHWVILTDSASANATEGFRRTVDILNQCALYSLAGLIVANAYDLFRHTRRLIRTPQTNGVPSPAA